MIIPASVSRKHALVAPYVDAVAQRVRDIVRGHCEANGYAYVGRKKDSQSLAEKIETGRFQAWSDLDDLFACSVIVPTLSHEPNVLAYLRSEFEEVESRLRGATQKDPSVFRFDATRFIGRLRVAEPADRSVNLSQIKFEIQIRSAFEHAWSVTTHSLAYKSAAVDWRHMRLAAQLKATVEQLDQLILGFQETATFIPEQWWPEVVSRKKIHDFFEQQVAIAAVPSEAEPSSWGRFCENLHRLIASSPDYRPRDQVDFVEQALALLKVEIASANQTSFPRSISLLQFCLGALVKQRLLLRLNRYVPLVTPELLDLFPETRVLGNGFNLEEEAPA